jgi:hypothetical protein
MDSLQRPGEAHRYHAGKLKIKDYSTVRLLHS